MSRQAFAQARQKIKPQAIKAINDGLIAYFEKYDSSIITLQNHRVFAVDGSLIDLPENEILRETFGYSTGSNNSSHCKSRAMIGFDLFNQMCVYGEMVNLSVSETTQMRDISDYFANVTAYDNCIFNVLTQSAVPSTLLSTVINSQYLLRANDLMKNCANEDYLSHEMALECGILESMVNGSSSLLGKWEYISHKVVASPFKPVIYMDKMDIFG